MKRNIEGGQRPPGDSGMGGMHTGGGGMGGGGGMHGGGGRGIGRVKRSGGRPGGHGGTEGNDAKASDFWIKYELAKPTASFRAS